MSKDPEAVYPLTSRETPNQIKQKSTLYTTVSEHAKNRKEKVFVKELIEKDLEKKLRMRKFHFAAKIYEFFRQMSFN